MIPLLMQHYELVLMVVAYVAFAAVRSLPDPEKDKFQFYPWFYHTVNLLLNNVPAKYQPKNQNPQ